MTSMTLWKRWWMHRVDGWVNGRVVQFWRVAVERWLWLRCGISVESKQKKILKLIQSPKSSCDSVDFLTLRKLPFKFNHQTTVYQHYHHHHPTMMTTTMTGARDVHLESLVRFLFQHFFYWLLNGMYRTTLRKLEGQGLCQWVFSSFFFTFANISFSVMSRTHQASMTHRPHIPPLTKMWECLNNGLLLVCVFLSLKYIEI